MATLTYTTLDVFTTEKFAGNPLAVVNLPSTTTLSQSQKQTIAREFNFSETVFLHECSDPSASIPEWQLDIFTTDRELPFAGHPTIGTACYILDQENKSKGRFKVKAGVIELEFGDGVARAAIPHNTHVHGKKPDTAEHMLEWQKGLEEFYEEGEVKVDIVSPVLGMNFLMVELRDLEELAKVTTPGSQPLGQLDREWDQGPLFAMFFVKMEGRGDGVRRLRTRMIEGLWEDPATGSASCGLAAYLVLKDGVKDGKVVFEMVQAVEMGRKSVIGVEVEVKGGEIQTVVLEGRSVKVMEGKLFYE